MEIKQFFEVLNQFKSPEEKIEMILSYRMDYGGGNGGMISAKRFNIVAKDIIKYFKIK